MEKALGIFCTYTISTLRPGGKVLPFSGAETEEGFAIFLVALGVPNTVMFLSNNSLRTSLPPCKQPNDPTNETNVLSLLSHVNQWDFMDHNVQQRII